MKEILEHKQTMGAMPHALTRLLLWVKKQVMSEDNFNAIVALEHHYAKRNDRWLDEFENNEDAVLEPTLEMAYKVKHIVNSKLGLSQVQKLLCIVRPALRCQKRFERATDKILILASAKRRCHLPA